jgi:hypothetical protein
MDHALARDEPGTSPERGSRNVDHTPTNDPMDEDRPLYLPEEFERDHLVEARRAVANSRGGRAVARRVTSAALPRGVPRARTHVGIAVAVHAVAALLVLAIAAATGTWAVGLAMLGMVAISLAGVVGVLHVVARNGAPVPKEPDPSRPDPHRPH